MVAGMVAVITAVLAGSTACLAAILIFDQTAGRSGDLRDADRASDDGTATIRH